MTQWYSKDLGDGTQAFVPKGEIQKTFLPLFVEAGKPIDMAVFSRYDLDRNVVTVFFAPRASALATIYGAQPCEKPKNEGSLSLLVGDARCWQHFY